MGSTCSIPGCHKPCKGFGWCRLHYHRWCRNGDPETLQHAPRGAGLAWLKAHVGHQSDECLLWPYGAHPGGYGSTTDDNGRVTRTNRLMCKLAHGEPKAAGLEAAHSCRVPRCCNPRHLRWATPAENTADKIRHGTVARNRGSLSGNAKLSESSVVMLRQWYRDGQTQKCIATQLGVTREAVSSVLRGRTWAHVSSEVGGQQ